MEKRDRKALAIFDSLMTLIGEWNTADHLERRAAAKILANRDSRNYGPLAVMLFGLVEALSRELPTPKAARKGKRLGRTAR